MADAWTAHHVDPISSAASDDANLLDTVPWNGASFLSQIRIAHVRYIEKQVTGLSSFYIEVGVALVLGLILGFSQSNNEVVGYFVYPFARVSSTPLTALMPQMHMYAFMSLGLATGTAGVNVFVIGRKFCVVRVGSCSWLLGVKFRCDWFLCGAILAFVALALCSDAAAAPHVCLHGTWSCNGNCRCQCVRVGQGHVPSRHFKRQQQTCSLHWNSLCVVVPPSDCGTCFYNTIPSCRAFVCTSALVHCSFLSCWVEHVRDWRLNCVADNTTECTTSKLRCCSCLRLP
ncbi:transmembrane protein, putative [Bodo saltans]|uniref:Transmembrane protein, putative n=1 Tax=Bodo saltans TaxID=75058 RepID=A0A0S4JMW4_BODSA|nr:transmembrane protein, putative [Bodo saltans]|eukprot:CUG91749.1 transmembrane protein, putative [Bodo saltans]